jgi:threonine/homoserine/homoserine lactone efflux protein
MVEILPAWPLLAAFLLASLILAVTPGPGVFYIVSRSLLDGRRHGLVSVAGVALGNLGNALGACLGLAALFAISSTAFLVVKYAGALYLLYLGLRALFAARPENTAPQDAANGLWRSFRDGGIVALLNPKTALFFAAFLPQFMDAHTAPLLQGMALGALFVAIAALTDSVYALAAGSAAAALTRLRGSANAGRYLKGGVFIGLGLFTALAGNRTR